jgi:hypothetical protein
VKLAIALLLLGACTDDDAPTSSASLTSDPTVLFSHVDIGFISHGGADRDWKVSLTIQDGCLGGTTPDTLEIDLLADGSTLVPGVIPIRTTDTPDSLPSALWTGPSATVSGSITITSASADRVEGNGTISTADGDTMLRFSALVCSTM